MKDKIVTMPELALIAGTRMVFGAGIGLLLADRFDTKERRAIGWTLLAIGALTTIPLAAEVMLRHGSSGNGLHPRMTGASEPVSTD